MAGKNIVLVSSDETLNRKLGFAVQLIGLELSFVRCSKELRDLKTQEPSAVFFDDALNFGSAVELALNLKSAWKNRIPTPMFLLTRNRELENLSGENAVFDDLCHLPFLRKDLYKLLNTHRILDNREIRIMPFVDAVAVETVQGFIKKMQGEKNELEPVFSTSYHYPLADDFFPGDAKDSITLLLNLYAQGVLDRKPFDRVHQCPHCSASQTNFRECCPQCHSIDFSPIEMLHHFPCGYVGDSEEFRQKDSEEYLCPKCGKQLRHIGMDYEKPISAYRCNSCRMHFSIPAVRCLCFECHTDFAPSEAVVQTYYSYHVRENFFQGSGGIVAAQPTEPFSVPKDTFLFMLRQNFGISRELGYDVQLIAVDGSGLRDTEKHELLRMLHEFKRPVDVVYASPHGVILILLFYLSSEAVREKVEQFRALRRENPLIGRRKLNFQIHRYPGTETVDAEKLLDELCMEIPETQEIAP